MSDEAQKAIERCREINWIDRAYKAEAAVIHLKRERDEARFEVKALEYHEARADKLSRECERLRSMSRHNAEGWEQCDRERSAALARALAAEAEVERLSAVAEAARSRGAVGRHVVNAVARAEAEAECDRLRDGLLAIRDRAAKEGLLWVADEANALADGGRQ